MAVSRILFPESLRGDDHLSHPAPVLLATRQDRHLHSQNWGWTPGEFSFAVMRRYPRIDGPAALPLFCLAPHGVFRASRIAPRAVSSYLAFSPLPALCCQRTGGVFSVTLSVTAIPRLRDCSARVFYAACRRMVFGLSSSKPLRLTSDHLPSRLIYHN